MNATPAVAEHFVTCDSAPSDINDLLSLGPGAIPAVDAQWRSRDGSWRSWTFSRLAPVALPGDQRRAEAMNADGRLTYAGATAAIVCAGLLCRWPALGLPWPLAKYSGSALWGAMVYAGLRAINPRLSVPRSAILACAIAVCVELFRLYRQPELDAFRATLAGKLLLGSIFSPWNVVAYVAGIGCAALVDGALRSHSAPAGNLSPRRT